MEQDSFQAVLYETHPQRIGVERLLKVASRLNPKPFQIVLTSSTTVREHSRLFHAGVDDLYPMNDPNEQLSEQLLDKISQQAVLMPRQEQVSGSPLNRLVGRSAAISEIKRQLVQLASARSSVLFTGETGTGKTLAAEVLHEASPRAGKPFLRVYCPALPRALVESELFGHEKGSFTDAKETRLGAFERAHGGTLLLEEVGDLPGPTQSNILRFLETGEVRRVGSDRIHHPDTRVLVATAENLEDLVLRGGIRKSLLYRVEGIRIHMPPLRQRPEDIRDLVGHLITILCQTFHFPEPRITRRALQRLSRFDWPGNVRQLMHTLEGMIATSKNELIDIADIPLQLRGQISETENIQIPLGSSLSEVEKTLISGTLKMTGGNKVQTSKILGIGLKTLYRKIKLYDL